MDRSQSTPTSVPPKRRFARTRWLYQDQGRDVGPFRPDEIGELLTEQTINLDTLVRETASQQWKKLGAIPDFSSIVTEASENRVARAKEKAFDKKVRAAQTKRRLPLLIGAFITFSASAGGGWYAWTTYQAGETPPPSGYTQSLFRSLSLRSIPARAYLNTNGPIAWAEESVELRKSTKDTAAGKSKKDGSRSRLGTTRNRTANDLEPEKRTGGVRELSFEDESEGTGRELDGGDVQMVRNRAVPRLVRCAQSIASSQSNWPGTTVRFRILSSGKMGSIRIGANGRKNSSFVGCVRKALTSISIAPFDGPGRTLTVPLKVGR